MLKHGVGRGRGSGAIFSSLKGTESFIEFLRAVLEIGQVNRKTKGEAGGAIARLLLRHAQGEKGKMATVRL